MKAIVCYDKKTRGIGENNRMLFNINEDINYFKAITEGKIVVMGRNTYNSLPFKPLPNRINITITKFPEMYTNSTCQTDGTLFMTLPSFLNLFHNMKNTDDIFVIGGEEIYKQLLPYCDTVYATEVYNNKPLNPDAYFPELPGKWDKETDIYLCNCDENEVYTTLYRRQYSEQVVIPRAVIPNEYNCNGVKYDKDSYNKALNNFKERYRFFFEDADCRPLPFQVNAPCEIIYGNAYENWSSERFITINPINAYGTKIIAVSDHHCTLEFYNKELCEKVKEAVKQGKAYMLMRYKANINGGNTSKQLATILSIVAFDLNICDSPAYIKKEE